MKNFIIKRFIQGKIWLVFVLSIFLLFSCIQKEPAKTDSVNNTDAQNNATLRIGILNVADSAVLLAGQSTDVFKEFNADVELVEFGSASDQSKAMEAGKIDGMMTDLIVQSLVNKSEACHLKTVLVALGDRVENGKFIIAAAPNNKHNSIEGLAKAKIAISENTSMEFLLDSYMDVLGLDLNSIEKVNVPNIPLRMEMLLNGKDIDAAILPEPLGDYSLMKGASVVIDDTKLDTNLSVSVIAIDSAYIDKNTENVKNFINAYEETAKRINSDKDKYREMVMNIANVPDELKELYEMPTYSEKKLPDKELFDRVQKWMLNKGLIEKAYAYADMTAVF